MSTFYDLAIVGGGAAGLACGVAAGRLGLRVVVIERNYSCGRKLALTGGRKCNFTHAEPPRVMAARFDCAPELIMPLLRRFPYQRIVKFFESLGIAARTDEEGCIWPAQADAAGIVDSLVGELTRTRSAVITGVRVVGVDEGWSVKLSDGRFINAAKVCLATGGASYPQTGSTGDGLGLASRLGLTTTPWFPALASLRTSEDLRELAGISQPRVGMSLLVGPSRESLQVVRRAQGHFIFAHEYVSGSSVLNLCGFAARALAQGQQVVLRVDWTPEKHRDELAAQLATARVSRPRAKLATVLASLVSRRLAARLCQMVQVDPDRLMAGLTRRDAETVVRALKSTDLEVVGTEPLERATVVGGGVGLEEVNLLTMEARRRPGLYVAGEVLDLWAETGGFNLHFAWASGIAAAEAAAGRTQAENV
ncbi:MAG: aminoacetone oxidase family FAD-binding enzyme [candidate division WOR-3 bacterium]